MRGLDPWWDRCRYPGLIKPEIDNVFDRHLYRRLSWPLTATAAALKLRPNMVTAAGLPLAAATAAAFAAGWIWFGIAGIHAFRVAACVDGELARVTASTSRFGDFADTVSDRLGEMLILAGIGAAMASGGSALLPVLAYAGALLTFTVSTEKFRAAFGTRIPRRRVDGALAWLVTGGDSRAIMLSLLLAASAVSRRDLAGPGFWAMSALLLVAVARRIFWAGQIR